MLAIRTTPIVAALLKALLRRADPAARATFDAVLGGLVVDSVLDRSAIADLAARNGIALDDAFAELDRSAPAAPDACFC